MIGILAPAAVAQGQYDVPGVFTFNYGDGWTKGARKGAPPKELDWLVNNTNHDANFHADVTESEVSFDNWVNEAAKQVSPSRALVSRDSFTTTSGLKGYKLTWKVKTTTGHDFVRDQYFFHGNHDAKIQLSGMAPAADAATFDPVYDAFAKSLTVPK
jgi:hypothetical protein